jgi:hypothetical protein
MEINWRKIERFFLHYEHELSFYFIFFFPLKICFGCFLLKVVFYILSKAKSSPKIQEIQCEIPKNGKKIVRRSNRNCFNLTLAQNQWNQIRCRAIRGPFDHFEICANSNLKVLTRISKWSNGPRASLHGSTQQRIRVPKPIPPYPLLPISRSDQSRKWQELLFQLGLGSDRSGDWLKVVLIIACPSFVPFFAPFL